MADRDNSRSETDRDRDSPRIEASEEVPRAKRARYLTNYGGMLLAVNTLVLHAYTTVSYVFAGISLAMLITGYQLAEKPRRGVAAKASASVRDAAGTVPGAAHSAEVPAVGRGRRVITVDVDRVIAVIAIALTPVMVFVVWREGRGVEYSLSLYYYTPMRSVFVVALCAIGLLLLLYRGFSRTDDLLTRAASLACFAAALFPVESASPHPTTAQELIPEVHLTGVSIMFILLSVIVFRFARPGSRVHGRNLVYLICGGLSLTCVVLTFPMAWIIDPSDFPVLLLLEGVALASIGVAWFVQSLPVAAAASIHREPAGELATD
jgi:hypothetical protein